jgi:hypothetical protein
MPNDIVILGTPADSWVKPMLAFAERVNRVEQEKFRLWHNELFGPDTDTPPSWSRLTANQNSSPSPMTKLAVPLDQSRSSPLVLADPRACWSAELLLAQDPRWTVLALYELPEEVIAQHAGDSDSTEVLAAWKSAARKLLALVRRHRTRITLLAAGECRAESDSWTALLRERHELTSAPAWNEPAPSVGVPLALGALQASADHEVSALLAELEAASEPLSASGTAPRHEVPALTSDGWRDLRTKNALAARLSGLEQSFRELERKHSSLAAEHEKLDSSFKETSEENELLLQQLHQVQEELEHRFLENRRLASRDTACKELEAKCSSLVAERDALVIRRSSLDQSFKELERKHSSLAAEHEKLIASFKDTAEENELLLQQLHQVQEELEHHFLENRRLARQMLASGSQVQRTAFLLADGLRLGSAHDTGPHRHLNFVLENVRLGDRSLGDVHLRLVEHHGRPGLAVFRKNAKEDAPLLNWNTSGEENGRHFALAVPQDEAGRKILVAAPTSDFLLLRESALILSGYLASEASSPGATSKMAWSRVARAFAEVADDLTPCLRCDGIKTFVQNGTLHFTVRHACSPGRYIPSLDLAWRASSVAIKRPATSFPLLVWPTNAQGEPASEAVFDLGNVADTPRERKAWAHLTSRDRQLVELVVAELPTFVDHLVQQHPQGIFDANQLRAEAARMQRRAKAYSVGHRPKRFLGLT